MKERPKGQWEPFFHFPSRISLNRPSRLSFQVPCSTTYNPAAYEKMGETWEKEMNQFTALSLSQSLEGRKKEENATVRFLRRSFLRVNANYNGKYSPLLRSAKLHICIDGRTDGRTWIWMQEHDSGVKVERREKEFLCGFDPEKKIFFVHPTRLKSIEYFSRPVINYFFPLGDAGKKEGRHSETQKPPLLRPTTRNERRHCEKGDVTKGHLFCA